MRLLNRNVPLAVFLTLTLGFSGPVQRTVAAPQDGGRGEVHRDDPCTHLPNPPGNAEGIEKQCPALGSSNGIAKGDFNGDGFADLAIGEPGATIHGAAGAGDVIVIMGSASGLTSTGDQLWYEGADRKLPSGPAAGDGFGSSLASGDFNADGFSDLAIGIPGKAVPDLVIPGLTHQLEGAVMILYGSANGLTSTDPNKPAPQFMTLNGLEQAAFLCTNACSFNLDNAHFGQSLAWGNFNGDVSFGNPVGDLAIGAPATQIGFNFGSKSGAVFFVIGKPGAGVTLDNSRITFVDEIVFSGTDTGNDGESFGAALTAGDYNGDGLSDLAIGAPGKNLNGVTGAGEVFVLTGNANINVIQATAPHRILGQPLLGTAPRTNDAFGGVLASGDFNGDGKSDLAMGVPNFDIGPLANAGVVVVRFGDSTGISTSGLQQLWAGAHFHNSLNEAGARFASALTTGDFNGDGFADLAIGVPFKDIVAVRNGQSAALADAGEVDVIYGSSSFLLQPTNGLGAQVWTQENLLGSGSAAASARFGAPLTAWNFGHNETTTIFGIQFPKPTADLAVGVPFQTVNGVSGAGAVDVIYGSFHSNGLSLAFTPNAISGDSLGLGGLAGAHFGAGLY